MKALIEEIKKLDDNSKKKIKLFGIGFIVVIILIILLSIIISIVMRKTSYEDVEEIMEKAAYEYYQNNLGQLPNGEVKTSVVSAQTLEEQKYMKSIVKYTKNESCTGNVVVTYNDGDYDYQGYLTCNDFTTSLLVDKIKKDNPTVTTGAGLYDENGLLRFRGEQVNNYLKIKDTLYRIIKIDTENKIYITPQELDDNDENIYVYWDDRYNSEEDSSCGINDYSVSRIRDSLNNIYENLDKELKENMVSYDLCVNKRNKVDVVNEGTIECASKIENQKIGLLPLYEYIKGSIATSCTKAESKECKNYNYLVMNDSRWWTLTANNTNTYHIFYITGSGEIDEDKGYNRMLARYVVALKPNVLLKDGIGTEDKPYEIR